MRLTGLSIDGFGLFHDVEVPDLPPGLSLFLGDNEAGKSTTLAFVHTVLFGYPDGRTKENDYPPLRGGQAGGRLLMRCDNIGESDGPLTLERRAGKKGGLLTVTFPDGRSEGDAALSRLLGGVTRSLYRKLYAFSLYELEQLNSLSDESVRDVIYGASLGTTSLSLPEVRRRLEDHKGELFKPSGSKPQINGLLKDLEVVRASLREARRGTGEYEKLTTELGEVEGQIETARAALHEGREGHERLKAHAQLWDDWAVLLDLESRLAALPEVVEEFPTDGVARLDDLTAKMETETESLRLLEEDLKEKGERLQRLSFDAKVLEREADIGALVRGLGTYEQSVAELPRVREGLKSQKRQAEEVLAEIGAGRSEAWVLGVDRSTVAQGQIEAHREALGAAHRRVEKTADAQQKVQEERDHLKEESASADERVEALERALGDEALPETLTALRERRTQFQDVLKDLPGVARQRAEATEDLAGALRDISPEWSADTLEAFDASLTARQRVADHDTRLAEAAAAARETEGALARAQASLDEAEAAVQLQADVIEAEAVESAEGEEAPPDMLLERKVWIRSLRDHLFRHESMGGQVQVRRQVAEAGAADSRSLSRSGRGSLGRRLQGLAAVMAAVAVVGGAGLWLTAGPVAGLAAGAALVLAAVALFVAGRAAAAPADPGLASSALPGLGVAGDDGAGDDGAGVEKMERELEATAAAIEDLKQKLALSGEVTVARVNDLEDENGARMQQAEDRVRLGRALEELQTARDRRVEARDAAAAEVEGARAWRGTEEAAWQTYVGSLHLPAGTSPRTAGEVYAKAETARGLARQMAEYDRRLEAMGAARDEYLDLMKQVPKLADAARGNDGEAQRVALAEFLMEAARQDEQRQHLTEARKAAERVAQELAAANERLEQVSDEHARALAGEEEAQSAWTDWLGERGMEETWSPDTGLRLLDRAVRLAELAAARDEAAETADRLLKDQEAFLERVAELCGQLDRPKPPPDKRVAEVHALETELARSREQHTRHEALADEIPDLETRRASRRERVEELRAETRALVEKGKALDEEAFRVRGGLYGQRRDLLEAMAEHGERVKKVAGATELAGLRQELADQTLPGLTVAAQEAQERVAELEHGLGELRDKRVRCDQDRRQLLDEDNIARLRAEEEDLLERYAELSQDWARHAAALHLLSAAKERFEKSHQPEVIRRAGEYFRGITGGRYKEVFAPHGEQTVEVVDERDRRVAVEDLSRGTSEQLYLAIRFGYIASQDAHGERLPLLMDDVMVNFDPTRASQAAEGILEMAQTHQVLFFTCHPEVVEVFRGHQGDVPVYGVGGGEIRVGV